MVTVSSLKESQAALKGLPGVSDAAAIIGENNVLTASTGREAAGVLKAHRGPYSGSLPRDPKDRRGRAAGVYTSFTGSSIENRGHKDYA
ncbi:hypothetical protein HDU88_007877 [Geranomyces variabilis]|nr:hypothetical protein HDU88_007877 [Geranomyces variabilis]